MVAKTIAILPGFGEGSWHTARLHRQLRKLGYQAAPDVRSADVVITHSAGCFFLPENRRAQLLILIDPPYWPGRSNWTRLFNKLWWDVRANLARKSLAFYIRKTAWNWIYILVNLVRVARIAHYARRHNFHVALVNQPAAIIRNDNDAWLMPHPERSLPPRQTFTYHQLPGQHDDCWYDLSQHAALIDEIITKRLAV